MRESLKALYIEGVLSKGVIQYARDARRSIGGCAAGCCKVQCGMRERQRDTKHKWRRLCRHGTRAVSVAQAVPVTRTVTVQLSAAAGQGAAQTGLYTGVML